jgi:hypothetical protein
MATLCYPIWHSKLSELASAYGRTVVAKPGCGVVLKPNPVLVVDGTCRDVSGNWGLVPCSPETLRSHAENALASMGLLATFGGRLPLDVYSLARNIAAEQQSGTVEEKVALALSTLGQARKRGVSASDLILSNNRGKRLYGRIHGYFDDELPIGSPCEKSTRFGRWTASTKDPTILDLLIAQFVFSGGAGEPGDPSNFAGGADDQAALGRNEGWMKSQWEKSSYWIGDRPGINPRTLTLFATRKDIAPNSPEGRALLERGLQMQRRLIATPFVSCGASKWPFVVAVGVLGAAFTFGRWMGKNKSTETHELFAKL